MPKRVWKSRTPRGRPIKKAVPRDPGERTFAWFQRKDRRLVVRWERLAPGFNAFLAVTMIPLWGHQLIAGLVRLRSVGVNVPSKVDGLKAVSHGG
jgi:hypothetical protein